MADVAPWDAYASQEKPNPEPTKSDVAPWDAYKAPEQKEQGFLDRNPTVKSLVGTSIDALPMIGSIGGELLAGGAGAVEGLATGGAASVPLAIAQGMAGGAAGGVVGSALKSYLEQSVLGIKKPIEEQIKDAGLSGLMGAAQVPIGRGLVAGAKMAAPAVGALATGVPADVIQAYMGQGAKVMPALLQATGGNAAEAAKVVQTKIAGAISQAKGVIEDPALQIINNRATSLSNFEAGGAVKQLLSDDIKSRNGIFSNAYNYLDQANQSLPLKDEERRTLTQGLKDWAVENHPNSSDTYKLIQKHTANLDASNTGAQFQGAMADINKDLTTAYKSGDSPAIKALTEIQNKAGSFYDSQINSLAKAVQSGSASEQQLAVFQKMADSNGVPPGDDLKRYAKSIGNDYLKNANEVDKLYGGFKQYLGDVQEQTGARRNQGAMTLLKSIDSIPNEKLIDNMFKPQNVASLTKLKSENPEIFQQIASTQIRDLAAQSTNKAGSLDATAFQKNVMDLPKEVRNLMFSPEEMSTLNDVAGNKKLMRLNELTNTADKGLFTPGKNESSLLSAGSGKGERHLRDLGELSNLTGQNLVQDAQALHQAVVDRDAMLAQQKGVQDLRGASAKGLLTKSGLGAAAGFGLGEMTGVPMAAKALSTVGGAAGALSSPFSLKTGIDLVSKPAAAPVLGQSVMRGGQGIANLISPGKPNP